MENSTTTRRHRVRRNLIAAAMLTATLAAQDSPAQNRAGIGAPGTGKITVGWRFIEADRFYRHNATVDGPYESKQSLDWQLTYTASRNMALHVGSSWGRFFAASGGSPTGNAETHHGRQDTTLGLTWRLRGETPYGGPNAAVRISGRIPGPYDAGYTNSLGDGATELQGSVVLENFNRRIGWTTELGYRHRTHAIVNPLGIGEPTPHYDKVDVPRDTFGFAGLYAGITNHLQIGAEYSGTNGRRGLDIDAPDWRPDRWPALHEDLHVMNARLDIRIKRVGTVTTTFGKVFRGRNTPAYTIYGVSWSRAFGQPRNPIW